MIKEFRRRRTTVKAMQFDGTRAGARRIIHWLLGSETPARILHPEGDDWAIVVVNQNHADEIQPGDWVVEDDTKGRYRRVRSGVFESLYEALPPLVAWVDEYDDYFYVLGTHDALEGAKALRAYIDDNRLNAVRRGERSDALSAYTYPDIKSRWGYKWVAPDMVSIEGYWPSELVSDTYKPGWTPLLTARVEFDPSLYREGS